MKLGHALGAAAAIGSLVAVRHRAATRRAKVLASRRLRLALEDLRRGTPRRLRTDNEAGWRHDLGAQEAAQAGALGAMDAWEPSGHGGAGEGSAAAPGIDEMGWQLVCDQESLAAAVSCLRRARVVGLDIEQHRAFSFQGLVCLIQLSDGRRTFLVDPLCDALPPTVLAAELGPLLLDPGVTVVVHGGRNDLTWLQRDFGLLCANVFDTFEAHALLTGRGVSLAVLWRLHCGCEVSEGEKRAFQAADWRERPLTAAMQRYAAMDAALLPRIYDAQLAQLRVVDDTDGRAREQELRRVCATMTRARYACPPFSAAKARRRFMRAWGADPRLHTSTRLAPAERAFAALCEWRDRAGREMDLAPKAVLPDKVAFALACSQPRSASGLRRAVQPHLQQIAAGTVGDVVGRRGSAAPRASPADSDDEAHSTPAPTVAAAAAAAAAFAAFVSLVVEAHADELLQLLVEVAQGDAGAPACEPSPPPAPATTRPVGPAVVTAAAAATAAAAPAAAVDAAGGVGEDRLVGPAARLPGHAGAGLDPERAERKQRRLARHAKAFAAKRPVYESCRMLAPDGQMLCYCDRRKVRWYLKQGLAELVAGTEEQVARDGPLLPEEEAPTIRLRFAPNTRGVDHRANQFYLVPKDNRCVACGSERHLMRFHVVPRVYRQHFPEELKSHRAHDVVLLCVHCHGRAGQAQAARVKQMAREYGVPLAPRLPQSDLARRVRAASTAATALLTRGSRLPSERALELRVLVLLALAVGDGAGAALVRAAAEAEAEAAEGGEEGGSRKQAALPQWWDEVLLRARRAAAEAAAAVGDAEEGGAGDGAEAGAEGEVAGELEAGRWAAAEARPGTPTTGTEDAAPLARGDAPAPPPRSGAASGAAQRDEAAPSGPRSRGGRRSGWVRVDASDPDTGEALSCNLPADSLACDAAAAAELLALGRRRLEEATPAALLRAVKAMPAPPVATGSQDRHGLLVVNAAPDLGEFVRQWRRHFLESMAPQHLPPLWGVDHQVRRTFGENSKFKDSDGGDALMPTRFRGVWQRGDRYVVRISLPKRGGCEELGDFTDDEVAARAYDERARELYKATAITNY